MRITNKIMQNNSLSNINTNKILQDKLNTQMSTQKKINRPSEDPVIAIRALRLRSSLSDITQYYEKNVPDATSWLEVTDGSLNTVGELLEEMYSDCQKGSSDHWQAEDRAKVLESLKGLKNELYSTGDVDYAGRNVFTGYRTGTKLTFQNDTKQKYTITEQLSREDIDQTTYVKNYSGTTAGNTHALEDVNSVNYDDAANAITEQDIKAVEVYRIRLSYDNLDAMRAGMTIQYGPTGVDANGNVDFSTAQSMAVTGSANSYDLPDPYTTLGENDVVYLKDTGEILLGKNQYERLMAVKDDPDTQNINEGEIRITYDKSEWQKGDLNPVHYFACSTRPDGATSDINYNADYLKNVYADQAIEYDVGFNQTIRVNTTADEVYTHNIGRDVDELIQAVEDVIEMEGIVAKMKELVDADAADTAAKEKYDAANKSLTLLQEKMRKLFSGGMTRTQSYQNQANQAIADCGTRGARLELIENRLKSQQTTFDTLASDNENADLTQVAIELSSAELSYNAALMATGKVVQNSLLNFL